MVWPYEAHSPASDVYSFGLALWELIYCRVALGHLTSYQVSTLRLQNPDAAQPLFECQPVAMGRNVLLNDSHSTSTTDSAAKSFTRSLSHHTAKISANVQNCGGIDYISCQADTRAVNEMQSGPAALSPSASIMPFAPAAADSALDAVMGPVTHAPPTGAEDAHAAIDAVQWKEIVELVRQCWELEGAARPTAVRLERQLQPSISNVDIELQPSEPHTVIPRVC